MLERAQIQDAKPERRTHNRRNGGRTVAEWSQRQVPNVIVTKVEGSAEEEDQLTDAAALPPFTPDPAFVDAKPKRASHARIRSADQYGQHNFDPAYRGGSAPDSPDGRDRAPGLRKISEAYHEEDISPTRH